MSHPMMPEATHDERAEQDFIRDLKIWLGEQLDPLQRQLVEATSCSMPDSHDLDIGPLRRKLLEHDAYRSWISVRRASQEMMWDAVGSSIDRQLESLTAKAAVSEPRGSVTLNPAFTPPRYIAALDVHMMPGGYAHARAEHLGQRVHYVQANAERTEFPDESFDFVFSCVLLQETSKAATRKIFEECDRLLRPGGVVIHCEVPPMEEGVWGKVICDFESLYNNESFWRGVQTLDLTAVMHDAGFTNVQRVFQGVTPRASRDAIKGFTERSTGVFRSWFMISARKS